MERQLQNSIYRGGTVMLATAALLIATTLLRAQTIKIIPQDTQGVLTVKIKHAGLRDVLSQIARHHGFQTKFSAAPGKGEQVLSTTLTGNLDAILDRLLRNTNHLIVRSSQKPFEIIRIVLIADVAPQIAKSAVPTPRPFSLIQPPRTQMQPGPGPVKTLRSASISPPKQNRTKKQTIFAREQAGWLNSQPD